MSATIEKFLVSKNTFNQLKEKLGREHAADARSWPPLDAISIVEDPFMPDHRAVGLDGKGNVVIVLEL